MTVIPWPLLPGSDGYDPNLYVYRIGHSLAHNDCMLRSRTNRAVLLDVDELIYSKLVIFSPSNLPFSLRNGSLPSLIKAVFNGTKIGGVVFDHHTLQYNPSINPSPFDFSAVDFKGVMSPSFAAVKGPKKVIFNPATVKRLGVHGVTQYLRNSWRTVQVANPFLWKTNTL